MDLLHRTLPSSLQTTHLFNQQPLRCAPVLPALTTEAPSLLQRSLPYGHHDLIQIAEDAHMAIGLTDHQGTLMWTWSSAAMLAASEQVHFVVGGHWSTQAVGNNAIGLSLNTHQTSCVYSHENQMESVRDWVCYATPIIDPYSGQFHGVINLSAQYKKHTPLGVLAVERCADLIQRALRAEQKNFLYIKALGTPWVQFNRQTLALTQRQIEILCILALQPQGIGLEELHHALYGERQVSLKTLKAELSQLRQLLPHCIEPRIYKLSCEVQADFLMAEQSLNQQLLASTFALYKGRFLTKSESPLLSLWHHCFDARLSQLIYQMQDVDQLLQLLSRHPERLDAVERLTDLLPDASPNREFLLQYLSQ